MATVFCDLLRGSFTAPVKVKCHMYAYMYYIKWGVIERVNTQLFCGEILQLREKKREKGYYG